MHFENVSILVNALATVLTDIGYCWHDKQGTICMQKGVFRVNCIDCLDRTNVVQTALGKAVMEMQFSKLGLIPPDGTLPTNIRQTFQLLWANNGDIISKQYAGTNALKGDYTRTGERKFTGLMKDGMNSANRYNWITIIIHHPLHCNRTPLSFTYPTRYIILRLSFIIQDISQTHKPLGVILDTFLSFSHRYFQQHFMDDIRQAAIDTLLGNPVDVNQLNTDWSHYLDILDNCCLELIPVKPPNIELQLATYPDILYASAMYDLASNSLGNSCTFRYYLNRFKDVYRQGTIDLMLGNCVNEEVFQERTEEEDNAATAIHVKLLIEDCKKLLIPDPEVILGSWGLIDADPVTGDLTETEMDTILILTRDSYYVADYDDQIDKVTNYQRVSLEDIVLIEFGQPESSVSLFKNKHFYCIRINYKVVNECGYFHMFRSTNLRFFNNMAVVIKTEEESIESLKSICEAISVAMEIARLPKIPIAMNVTLDRRKSKIVNSKGTTGLLDISSLPELTRNVSETQLLALKSAGTKALNNMSEQFSKLNKLSHSFSTRKPIDIARSIGRKSEEPSKPTFTVGSRDISGNVQGKCGSGSSSSDDEDVDIPRVSLEKPKNFSHDKNLMEAYTPSIGIIMGVKNTDVIESHENNEEQNLSIQPNKLFEQNSDREALHVPQSGSGTSTVSASPQKTPEITIQNVTEDKERLLPPSTLNLFKNISHSTGEVDSKIALSNINGNKLQTENRLQDKKRSTSEQDLSLNITSSQSESALKSIKTNIPNVTSPVASTAKDILSPFSKFAKGVQTLGANLDPRKLKTGQVGLSRNLSDHHVEQQRKLQERWSSCQSKLIAL
ncbi:hypothetical protein E2986_07266 [Frieseomelitta varia]|uniref:Phosphatidylinositide phosphatase SAC2 n=1 Tax=Frieseomelitta varia TaxID=561572 RepID=A0A833WF23_9HYME|nr:hypothetical protein E2986_07266 [Frieseomelitta varia]